MRSRSALAGLAVVCLAAPALALNISGTVRDFKGSFTSSTPFTAVTGGHPDFELYSGIPIIGPFRSADGGTVNGHTYGAYSPAQGFALEPGIVAATLGGDRKPVWVGGSDVSLFPTTRLRYNANRTNIEIEPDDNLSRQRFDQWYRDTPGVNLTTSISLTLTDPDGDGVFTYDNASFFPIDNQLFGNEGRAHNQHFTFEFHGTFAFQPGQTFTFRGDDDVWVFINGQRVIDLGGLHNPLQQSVNLNTLGLTAGNNYPIDFFFAERNTTASNFRIETSIPIVIPEPTSALALFAAIGVARRGRRMR